MGNTLITIIASFSIHSISNFHASIAFKTTYNLHSNIGLKRNSTIYSQCQTITTYRMLPRTVLFKGGRQWNGRHYGHRVPLLRLWTNVDRICGERFKDRLEAGWGWAAVVWSHGYGPRIWLTMRLLYSLEIIKEWTALLLSYCKLND